MFCGRYDRDDILVAVAVIGALLLLVAVIEIGF